MLESLSIKEWALSILLALSSQFASPPAHLPLQVPLASEKPEKSLPDATEPGSFCATEQVSSRSYTIENGIRTSYKEHKGKPAMKCAKPADKPLHRLEFDPYADDLFRL